MLDNGSKEAENGTIIYKNAQIIRRKMTHRKQGSYDVKRKGYRQILIMILSITSDMSLQIDSRNFSCSALSNAMRKATVHRAKVILQIGE